MDTTKYVVLSCLGLVMVVGIAGKLKVVEQSSPAEALTLLSPEVTNEALALGNVPSAEESLVAAQPIEADLLASGGTVPASQEGGKADQWKLFDPNSMRNHVLASGEFLFWQPHAGSLQYGTESTSTTQILGGHVKSPTFKWTVGGRAGLGYKIPHGKWDMQANYTYLDARATGHAGDASHVVFPLWARNADNLSSFYSAEARAHWNVFLNRGDVELGRNCFAGKWLTLRPFLGVRGETINQRYHVSYAGGTVATDDVDKVRLNTDFWGVGMRMGVNSLWGMGGGFSLFGNGSASVLSGHFDVIEKEKLANANLKKMHINSNVNNLVVDADVTLGLQWDYMFSRDRYHFGVKVGWEMDVFFNQNQLFHFVGSGPGIVKSPNDNLSFQGVTLGFRFDF